MLPIKLDLPEHFLDEEVRCGYTVTHKMKKVWAISLDLFNKFDQVCKKNNLTYFSDSGTTIGAIRHHGFIPWDDDIDIVMLRKDYDLLLSVAKTEFQQPYFFQTEYTDPGSARGHAQLRNSQTTGILIPDKNSKLKFNQGIFIDIFPLDNVPDDEELLHQLITSSEEMKQKALHLRNYVETYLTAKRWNFIAKIINKFKYKRFHSKKIYPHGYNNFLYEFDKIISQYKNTTCQRVANLSLMPYKDHRLRLLEDYRSFKFMPFEFLEIPVPVGFDRILTKVYGAWTIPKQMPSGHGDMILDPEKPYFLYI